MTSRTEILGAQKFLGFWVRVASAVVDSLGFAFVTSRWNRLGHLIR